MQYNTLTKRVARKINLSEKKTHDAMVCFTRFINDELMKANTVFVKGMGTFQMVEIAERRIYNPTNKQYTLVPKKSSLKFKPTNTFKTLFKK